MLEPTIPDNEAQRLAALRQLQILDTPSEERFDRLTRLARAMFDVPIALLSLVDSHRQWFKSKQGLDACETSRELSFCGHAILARDIFYIPNTLADPRFADNPLVTGPPDIRMYAGAPLSNTEGYRIGTLCIIDTRPRDFSTDELGSLRDLADCMQAEVNQLTTRNAEQLIQDQEARLHALVETVVDGIISIDDKGLIQTVNPAAEKLFAYPAAEMLGNNVNMLMPDPYTAEHDGYLDNYIKTGEARIIGSGREVLGRRKDGSTFPMELAISEMEVQGQRMFTGIVRDVSKRKALEEELKAYEAIVQSSDDAIISKTLEGIVTSWNPGAERMFGYTADEMLGQQMLRLFPPGSEAEEELILDKIRNRQRVEHFETVRFRKDGRPIDVSVTLSPIINDAGEVVGASKIARDITVQKSAVSELERTKARLEHFLSVNPGVIYACKAAGDYAATYISDNVSSLMGYKPVDFISDSGFWLRHIHPDDVERVVSELQGIFTEGSHTHEYRFKHADGQYRWMLDYIKLVMDTHGQPKEMVGLWMDISERKHIEAESGRYTKALELLHAISAHTRFGFKQKVNALLEMGGEVFDLPIGIVSRITDRQLVMEHVFGPPGSPAVNTGFELSETYCAHALAALRPTGFHNVGESKINRDPCYIKLGFESYLGAPIMVTNEVYGTLSYLGEKPRKQAFSEGDYSLIQLFAQWLGHEMERQQAEADLKEGSERIRSIVDTVVDGIVTINDKGIIETFNPAAGEIFQYNAEDVIGRNVKMLMPDPYRTEHDAYLDHYIESGEAKVIGIGREVTGQRKDGSTFPMELAVSEMDISGKRMFTGIVRDITERKQVERLKSEFISTVSHELRTPLTSIRGALGVVLGKAAEGLAPKARRLLETANRNSERLTFLINDILDLEKIESGKLEFGFEVVDLVKLTRLALESNEEYARQHEVHLKLDTELEHACVWGDSHRLMQVYANFISNAVKYSPKDGQVEIRIKETADGIRVSVEDHGRGIPEVFRQRIFQRFAQVDSTDARDKGGTGLGLSITKAIVERMGGSVNYESEMDRGSVFYFDLPKWQEVKEHAKANTAAASVLICEDNMDVADLLHELLSQEGVNSDIATTAAGARQLLAKKVYRLLLLDLTLPDMDGLELLRELRGDVGLGDMQIIVISGRADEGKRVFNGDAVSVLDWIQKPIDQERFSRSLQQALARKKRPRILHVEDDRDVIQVAESLLEDTADYVYATTLKQARECLAKDNIDLVMLDLSLPDGSGLELFDEIKGRCPVVVFSGTEPSKELNEQVAAALTKSKTSNKQLLSTIRKVLNS